MLEERLVEPVLLEGPVLECCEPEWPDTLPLKVPPSPPLSKPCHDLKRPWISLLKEKKHDMKSNHNELMISSCEQDIVYSLPGRPKYK